METRENPNIFEYADYREYLKDYYEHSKDTKDNFSYRYFAQKAGFASSNFLYLIIHGKRNLTKDYIPNFGKALGLSNLKLSLPRIITLPKSTGLVKLASSSGIDISRPGAFWVFSESDG